MDGAAIQRCLFEWYLVSFELALTARSADAHHCVEVLDLRAYLAVFYCISLTDST